MTLDQANGLLRTLLAAVGGYLANKGIVSGDSLQAIIAAAGPVLAAVWSFRSKAAK